MEHKVSRVTVRSVALALLIFSTAAAAVAQAPATPAPPGAAIFEKSCYSCHNIGGGDKKGPDLRGVTTQQSREWLHAFIQSPAAMNRAGDPVATGLFKKFAPEVMPDQTLSADQVDQILALIDDLSKKNEQFVPAGARLSRAILPTDIDEGYQLFSGRVSLMSGGTACISCHNVNGVGRLGGGTLGPDLTAALTKYKDPELISILQNPNFPTMKSVFGTKPLSDEEIVKLFAFLQNAKLQNPALQAQPGVIRIEPWFAAFGAGALLLSLVAIDRAWRKRLRGVREELVRRAKQ
jgi:mono/diheme cytochrome c family protein